MTRPRRALTAVGAVAGSFLVTVLGVFAYESFTPQDVHGVIACASVRAGGASTARVMLTDRNGHGANAVHFSFVGANPLISADARGSVVTGPASGDVNPHSSTSFEIRAATSFKPRAIFFSTSRQGLVPGMDNPIPRSAGATTGTLTIPAGVAACPGL